LSQSEKVTDGTAIPIPDWEVLVNQIAQEMVQDRSVACILKIRAKFYDLLSHCIPASDVLRTLAFALIPHVDDIMKSTVIKWAAEFDHRIKLGSKAIFHLEGFVARFMKVYEEYLEGMADF